MLPAEPKIFHGRESEMTDILRLFQRSVPRIAILGPGGMGKTSLAKAVLHHQQIADRFQQHRFFVNCESSATIVDLAANIMLHLGLKSVGDSIKQVLYSLSSRPSSLLVLDNLETVWEPSELRPKIEEFLSLISEIDHVALVVS